MKQTGKQGGAATAEKVREIISRTVEELGYGIWDVEFAREGAGYVLRITIDSENGIGIDDCEKVHRAIDPLLDEYDPIEQAYTLEVSSPGIERDLKTDAHINASVGQQVEVRLFAPVNGSKVHRGKLLGFDGGGMIAITAPDGSDRSFARDAIAKLSTVFEFGEI